VVGPLSGAPFGAYRRLEATIPLSEVKLITPCEPTKILAVGRNFPEHAREHGVEIPETR
jgi:2-keto-4-pentenoate hydratase/2-oxohepta-3-ene-1,7-dioic acid hydratase in catechol pathway